MNKRCNVCGYGLIEMSISILLFAFITAALAHLFALSYQWYQESAIYDRALLLLQDQSTGTQSNFSLDTTTRKIVTPLGPIVLNISVVSWQLPGQALRTISRVSFNDHESL